MPLTDKDLKLFARDAVDAGAETDRVRCSNRKAAVTFFEAALRDVRLSGYRVTARVRDGIWAELQAIQITAGLCEAA